MKLCFNFCSACLILLFAGTGCAKIKEPDNRLYLAAGAASSKYISPNNLRITFRLNLLSASDPSVLESNNLISGDTSVQYLDDAMQYDYKIKVRSIRVLPALKEPVSILVLVDKFEQTVRADEDFFNGFLGAFSKCLDKRMDYELNFVSQQRVGSNPEFFKAADRFYRIDNLFNGNLPFIFDRATNFKEFDIVAAIDSSLSELTRNAVFRNKVLLILMNNQTEITNLSKLNALISKANASGIRICIISPLADVGNFSILKLTNYTNGFLFSFFGTNLFKNTYDLLSNSFINVATNNGIYEYEVDVSSSKTYFSGLSWAYFGYNFFAFDHKTQRIQLFYEKY